MSDPLVAFAPRRCLDHALLDHDSLWTQDATTLFVDLAGFTSLTERLGALGGRGTEELSRLLGGFFGQVTETVTGLGGDPVAWGGDALTVVFDGPTEPSLAAATRAARAIQQLVRRAVGTPTSAGRMHLQARIGIARGQVTTGIARSARRWLPLNLGTGLDLAVAAETDASAGQLVMHASTKIRSAATRATSTSLPLPSRSPVLHAPDVAHLVKLAPPVLIDRLAAGRALIESHRSITVAFVRFPAVGEADMRKFLQTIGSMLELVDGLGGELVQVSGGDKGNVAMIVFGAPVAHADDPLRAVQAMLEHRRRNPSTAIGVATGPVFAALLGTERRLFPTHCGPAVIVAARLMQEAAPGQLLAETTTWSATSAHLRQAGKPTKHIIKGRVDPVTVHVLAGWRRSKPRASAQAEPPLVGRQEELRIIEGLLERTASGQGGLMVLEGVAGMGKSRLVRETMERATTRGFSLVVIDADDHPRGKTTGLWRDLVSAVLGISPRSTRKQWAEGLKTSLPDAGGQLASLETLLGLNVEPGRAASTLALDVQAELAEALLARLVATSAARAPLLLVIENSQRLDEWVLGILATLARLLSGVRVAILMAWGVAGGSDDMTMPAGERLGLTELNRDDAAVVASDTWQQAGGGSAPPWLAEAVNDRVGGNPLFARAVTRLMHASWKPGQPPPADDEVTAAPLTGVLAERVDRLPVASRQLLHGLAVARRPCRPGVIVDLLDGTLDLPTTKATASLLASEHFVRIDDDGSGERYRPLHDVLRHVVYESMSYAERQRLHRRMVECLGDIDADAVEIAEHVRHLDDLDLGRHWFPLASSSARASWDLPDAVRWLERALPLVSGPERDVLEIELLEVLLVAGLAYDVLEQAADGHGEAFAPYDRATAGTIPLADTLRARKLHAIAEAAMVCGEFDRCEAAAREAMRLTDGIDEARHQRAAEILVLARCQRGDVRGGVLAGEALVERASLADDKRAMTTARAALGAALLLSGQAEAAADEYAAALAGATDAGDVVQQIHILSDLAGCAFGTARYAECVQMLARARTLADTIGYRRHLAFNLNNEAQLRAALADPYATACAKVAVDRSLEIGDLANAANAVHTWITAKAGLHLETSLWRRLADIDTRLDRALAAATDEADFAVAAARSGRLQAAREAAASAARTARDLEQPDVLRRATLGSLLADFGQTVDRNSADLTSFLAGLDRLAADQDADEIELAEFAVERWRATQGTADREVAIGHARQAFELEPSENVRQWFEDLDAPLPSAPSQLPWPVGISRSRTTRTQLDEALTRIELAIQHRHPARPATKAR